MCGDRQRVPRNFWERTDAALRTGGTLATASDEVEAAARTELRAAARQVSTARQARTWYHRVDPATHGPAEGFGDGGEAPDRDAQGS